MPLQLLTLLKTKASRMACNTALYNWSLRGHVPEQLVMRPVDPWPGDPEAGESLSQGAFLWQGEYCVIKGGSWEPAHVSQAWLEHIHGFTWLRNLRAHASKNRTGPSSRELSRALVHNWISHYKNWQALTWQPDITGERMAMWLSSYDFFGEEVFADSDDEQRFQDDFFDSVTRQARHLSRALSHEWPDTVQGIGALQAGKGLLYAGLCLEGHAHWVTQSLKVITDEIDRQILGDGAHASRSPYQLLKALQILLDVRTALRAGDIPLPEKIQHAIDRMGPALRFFRYNDKKLSAFNGVWESPIDLIDCVLGQAGFRSKTLQSLPCAGFERLSQGRTMILMDCGATPARPYDRHAHAGPLSFEMTYGRERLFVNCGSHPLLPDWQDILRVTPAHNTVTLDHKNACEIKQDGHFARKTKKRSSLREEARNAILIEASHDGYVPLNGFVHRRRLYLSDQGHDLRGEDTLVSAIDPARPLPVAIRFHLHPHVTASLTQDGTEALLRMQNGTGWRFHIAGAGMALEESVYLGVGQQPRKTRQLVIYNQIAEKKLQIKWALQKEGA